MPLNLWLTPLIAGLFGLAGVWLGNTLSQRNSFKQAYIQKMRDLRISSYSKIMGIKHTLSQTTRLCSTALILCEYYDARAHMHNRATDQELSKEQHARHLSLISDLTGYRRELAEVLGDIKISFPTSDELKKAIDEVYSIPIFSIPEVAGKITTEDALVDWKVKIVAWLENEATQKVDARIDHLLLLLDSQIEKA